MDVLARSALDQSSLLKTGAISVEELLRAYLARIEALDPELRAFVQLLPDRAIARARALDRQRNKRSNRDVMGPLWGLPTAMKDLHMARGTFTRLGSRAFRYLWTPIDDVTTAAVRRSSMIVLGKLATSELAILPFVHTELAPPTRNPWDLARYSGGSSGGSSAAVASGLLPIAVASDGAGSTRIPAAFCGLIGHKPTRGLVPNPFAPFEALSLSTIGPHARSVDDAAALLDVLAPEGPDARTRSWARAAKEPITGPLRVKVTCESPIAETQPVVKTAVDRVARALASLGHHVAEGVAIGGTVDEFIPMFRYLAREMFVPRESALQPSTRYLRDDRHRTSKSSALEKRELFRAHVDRWLEGTDVYVTPTVASLAPEVGRWSLDDGEALFHAIAPLGAFTAAFNASGNPAISIPLWIEGAPVPVGVQLVGARGYDGALLSLARSVLEALGTPLCPLASLPARTARAR